MAAFGGADAADDVGFPESFDLLFDGPLSYAQLLCNFGKGNLGIILKRMNNSSGGFREGFWLDFPRTFPRTFSRTFPVYCHGEKVAVFVVVKVESFPFGEGSLDAGA